MGALAPEHVSFVSSSIDEMDYIGMFPMERHFRLLSENLPRLRSLYVQLVPRNGILQDSSKMKNVEADDLWASRNTCYASIVRELFCPPELSRGNYKQLQFFETGDTADRNAWLMAGASFWSSFIPSLNDLTL
jgi:hypothetical protein